MYAIFQAKGKQFRAEEGATLWLPLIDADPGDRITFDDVLLAQREGGEVVVGRPAIEGASVAAEIVRHGKEDKIVVFKMKRRKGYRKKQGHRQKFTEVRVVGIDLEGGPGAPSRGRGQTAARKEAAGDAGAPAEAPETPEAAATEAAASDAAMPEATDTARSLAEENGIDLATIEGTGKDGRILKSDVEKAIRARDAGE